MTSRVLRELCWWSLERLPGRRALASSADGACWDVAFDGRPCLRGLKGKFPLRTRLATLAEVKGHREKVKALWDKNSVGGNQRLVCAEGALEMEALLHADTDQIFALPLESMGPTVTNGLKVPANKQMDEAGLSIEGGLRSSFAMSQTSVRSSLSEPHTPSHTPLHTPSTTGSPFHGASGSGVRNLLVDSHRGAAAPDAVVVVPRWPTPTNLDFYVKVSLIFEALDRGRKGYWSEADLKLWRRLCLRETLEGDSIKLSAEIESFYQTDREALDEDYARLFRPPSWAEAEARRRNAWAQRKSDSQGGQFSGDLSTSFSHHDSFFDLVGGGEVMNAAASIILDKHEAAGAEAGVATAPQVYAEDEFYGLSSQDSDFDSICSGSDPGFGRDIHGDIHGGEEGGGEESEEEPEDDDGDGSVNAGVDVTALASETDVLAEKTLEVEELKGAPLSDGLEKDLARAVRGRVKANINALKLEYIFRFVTKAQRSEKIKKLFRSIPFVAEQTAKCQTDLLLPIFGLTRKVKRKPTAPRMLAALKLTRSELVENMTSAAIVMDKKLFDETRIELRINEFYDLTITAEIQLKVSRLLDPLRSLNIEDLSSKNQWIRQRGSPCTAFEAIQNLRKFLNSHSDLISDLDHQRLMVTQEAKSTLALAAIVLSLVEAKLIPPEEVVSHPFVVHLDHESALHIPENQIPEHHPESQEPAHSALLSGSSLPVSSSALSFSSSYQQQGDVSLVSSYTCQSHGHYDHQGRGCNHSRTLDLLFLKNTAFESFLKDFLQSTSLYTDPSSTTILSTVLKFSREFLFPSQVCALLALMGVDLLRDALPFCSADLNDADLNDVLYLDGEARAFGGDGDGLRSFAYQALALQTQADGENANESARDLTPVFINNAKKIQVVLSQLSSNTMVLPRHLADEAIFLLTDNMMNWSCSLACLESLGIFSLPSDPLSNTNSSTAAQSRPHNARDNTRDNTHDNTRDNTTQVVDIALEGQNLRSRLDWTVESLSLSPSTSSPNLPNPSASPSASSFANSPSGPGSISGSGSGFGTGLIEKSFLQVAVEGFASKSALASFLNLIRSSIFSDNRISALLFHHILLDQGLSISTHHSRILWDLIVSDHRLAEVPGLSPSPSAHQSRPSASEKVGGEFGDNTLTMMIPLREAAERTVNLIMQPISNQPVFNQTGIGLHTKSAHTYGSQSQAKSSFALERNTSDAQIQGQATSERWRNFAGVKDYAGFVTESIFGKLMWNLGFRLSTRHLRAIWAEIDKCALVLAVRGERVLLRVALDVAAIDPTRGFYTSIDRLKIFLPKILATGFSEEGISILLNCYLGLELGEEDLRSSEKQIPKNRFGLVSLSAIPEVLNSVDFKGINFSMLKTLLSQMQLALPEKSAKRVFDTLDVNHDHSLDLVELLSGFELLLSELLPSSILSQLNLTDFHLVLAILRSALLLILFLAFVALSFASFVPAASGAATAVQSLLALVGAIGLQSGQSQNQAQLHKGTRERLELVVNGSGSTSSSSSETAASGSGSGSGGGSGSGSGSGSKFLEKKMAYNRELMGKIAAQSVANQAERSRQRSLRPISLSYSLPLWYLRPPPAAIVSIPLQEELTLKPTVVLACGARVLSHLTTSHPISLSLDETHQLIRNGLTQLTARDAHILFSIWPPPGPLSGLEFSPVTGELRFHASAALQRLPPTTFTVTARNKGGAAKAKLSLHYAPPTAHHHRTHLIAPAIEK